MALPQPPSPCLLDMGSALRDGTAPRTRVLSDRWGTVSHGQEAHLELPFRAHEALTRMGVNSGEIVLGLP